MSKALWWISWLVMTLLGGSYLAYALVDGDKSLFLIGDTTHGHYQIELACDSCHGEAFAGPTALQASCVRCHGAELKEVEDSHPKSKFTDPRNAERTALLDAKQCVTCHREHRPGITRAMGVTLADDFCVYCHQDIADDRASHRDMAFDTCASAGCHNFHDNKALYEDFLVKHLDAPDLLEQRRVLQRDLNALVNTSGDPAPKTLTAAQHDAPQDVPVEPQLLQQWTTTVHARGGVNCQSCHGAGGQDWQTQPAVQACQSCHDPEARGFLAGRHGMRLAQDMTAMTPAGARQAMKKDAHEQTLNCTSCHGAHDFDSRRAAVEACLGCHDDQHSKAYSASSHYRLWQQEQAGLGEAGTGVSCATCHFPRILHKERGEDRVLVQHNPNMTLRPNEKMIRPVCLNCHGLGFAIDALADPVLIQNNFNGKPAQHITSLDMARERLKHKQDDESARADDG